MGFGPRQLVRNAGWKMVESCEETIALEESMERIRKLEETVGKMRTLQEGNFGKTFEKARHIETTKKPKLNGEQRPLGFGPRELQEDEQHYQGTNVGKWWKVVKKPLHWRWQSQGNWRKPLGK